MNPRTISFIIDQYITERSGLDRKRPYLGMSHIAECPKKVVNDIRNGISTNIIMHRNCYRGYMMESEIKKILISTGIMRKNSDKEIVANFDNRFRGHIDGDTKNGELIEIKTMSHVRYQNIIDGGKIPYKYYLQVQTYMRYGNYPCTYFIIASTETFPEMQMLKITPNINKMNEAESRAKLILKHLDNNTLPECLCKNCG